MPKKGSCGSCTQPDTAEDMVQCDGCGCWYHFSCVGVDASVEKLSWECRKCIMGKTGVDDSEDSSRIHGGGMARIAATTAAGRSSGQTRTAEGSMMTSSTMADSDLLMTSSAKDGFLVSAEMASATDASLTNKINVIRTSSLKLELEMLEEKRNLEMKYLERKYALLASTDADATDVSKVFQPKADVEERKVSGNVNSVYQVSAIPELTANRRLTAENLACRQSLSKDLPSFGGRPEEWAIFFSNYEHSTELCGYSDAENLVRLQKALKDDAKRAVGNMLLLPSTVPEVMRTLKWLYGRPELVIDSLIRKVRSEPPPKAEKFESLVGFALSIKQLFSTMIAADLEDHINNPTLLQELVSKLPPQLRLNWAMHSSTISKKSLREFSAWMSLMAEAASTLTTPGADVGRKMGHLNAHAEEQQTPKRKKSMNCFACHHEHRLVDCNVFKNLPISRKWSIVKENNICELCLKHFKRFKCTSNLVCGVSGCNQKHNALLHGDDNNQEPSTSRSCNAHKKDESEDVLFKIVPVRLHGGRKSIDTYAFLDCGSSLTLVEQELADNLGLKGVKSPLCLKWTANVARWEQNSTVVPIEISCINETKMYRMIDVQTVEHLGLPKQTFDAKKAQQRYKHLRGLPLPSYQQAQPRILIGLKNENLAVALSVREGKCNEPIAVKTRLGWLVCGGQGITAGLGQGVYHHYTACDCDLRLHQEVREFFTLDNHGSGKEYMETAEEKKTKRKLQAITKRVGQRYESGLLWRYDNVCLPNSYPMALRRLECLERRVKVEQGLLEKLNSQFENLVIKGYARKLKPEEIDVTHPRVWYLPTFIVKNPNKPGKIRLVWDAVAKVKGISLNAMLNKGPDQLVSLPNVLFAFRSRMVAICGDIAEMFHQVLVREEDRHAQRFLWRNGNSNLEPDVYEMNVLTFGASCSPSVAQFVMNINARQFAEKYPRAVMAVEEHHYVDDFMDSVDNVEEAVKLAKEVRHIHANGGFVIRNWLSNSRRVLEELGQLSSVEGKIIADPEGEMSESKVLGIWWRTEADCLTFSLRFARLREETLTVTKMPTKRELLRLLMSIFDPLGFLAHYLVKLKILLQEVWRQMIGWDEVIPENLHSQWKDWLELLPRVSDIEIPRCYCSTIAIKEASIQLHVFVDASEQAMAAVAFFRISDGCNIEVNIVSSKTKVAPRIPLSIPRMELHAAVIGARLADFIVKGHQLKIDKLVLWSDSRTVLSWLRSDARRYNQFVMYRLGEILEKTRPDNWRWIPSKQNVADDATKWSRMPSFEKTGRWFNGPTFLRQREEDWPEQPIQEVEEQRAELRPKYLLVHRMYVNQVIECGRFSSWLKLLRTTGMVLRYIANLRCKTLKIPGNRGVLSSMELQRAQVYLIKVAQQESFADEITVLKNGGTLRNKSVLASCSAYLDEDGLLRMKGRIERANCIDEGTKRPIIMPRDHRVTDMLVAYWHGLYHHCCHSTVINEIRQRYWIPRLRSKLQIIGRRCQECKLRKVQPADPEMAELPAARVTACIRPFTYVGVDYFGPLNVTVGRHIEKRWGVLFTCMTVRAVHMEMAYSLSTDSCIVCIRNFMARRGTPREFFSDNGTNFKGAESELKEAFGLIDKAALAERFNKPETTWNFNPPSAPHMGGSWERLVGSVKRVLRIITRNQRLQDESLHGFLLEAEAIVNSRPLTYVSLEVSDSEALTPNHFLLGSSSGSKLPGRFDEKDLKLRKNWRRCQQLADMFWRRWIEEYLPTLTRRSKWFTQAKPLKVGDVVVVVDKDLPRGSWPKGVIVGVNTAKDGQVRSATVKTFTGMYTRPTVKLALLDVRRNEEGETAAEQQHHKGGNVENDFGITDLPSH